MSELSMAPAKHGGYVVYSHEGRQGFGQLALFAGSLEDALGFIRLFYAEQSPFQIKADER